MPFLSAVALKRTEVAAPLKVARATCRALAARQQTLLRLTTHLCQCQDAALRNPKNTLVPLTQGEVAEALALHPSTISRAVAGKTAQTPRGIWALRDFFTALIDPETQLSGAQLRAWLVEMIGAENRAHPLSDTALASL